MHAINIPLQSMQKWLLALFHLFVGLSIFSTCHADEYQLGQGVLVADNLLLSGYSNVTLDAPRRGPSSLSVDDMSLFVNWRLNQWANPFAEIELSGFNVIQEGNAPRANGYLIAERLYNDFNLTPTETVRVGKMLSPVGDWNLIHAAPLVPISTRPLTTFRGFSEYATGASWMHQDSEGAGPDWQLYWQPGKEWFQRPDAVAALHYSDVWGGQVSWPLGLIDKIGVSFQRGEITNTAEHYTLLGINGRKTFGKLMLESEAFSSRQSGGGAAEHSRTWGIYGLADYAFTSRWHGIFECESYQDQQSGKSSRNVLVGVDYRPQPAVVWKLEYVHQYDISHDIPTGWTAAVALLF